MDGQIESASFPGLSVQGLGKSGRTDDTKCPVFPCDHMVGLAHDPGYQVQLHGISGFDHQLNALGQQVAGRATKQCLPLVEHDQPVRDLFQFSEHMAAEEDGLAGGAAGHASR